MYIQAEVGGRKSLQCNAMKETLKEMNRLKSHCQCKSPYLCTPERAQSPDSLAMANPLVDTLRGNFYLTCLAALLLPPSFRISQKALPHHCARSMLCRN